MTTGITTRPAEMRLTERAAAFLAAGPADVVALIGHICQLPNPPRVVAEHMATALFAGRTQFLRDDSGQWSLTPAGAHDRGAENALASFAPARVSEPYRATYAPPGVADLLSSLSYVVVDVETTGTRAWNGDRVTEIAAVVVRDGEVREVFETLVNPQRPIPPFISALTNITWSMVKDAPVFRDICERFLAVLEGNIFVAHNAGFDWRFVTAEVSRASGQQLIGRQLCTVRLARKLLPHLRSRSLDNVAAYYGVDIKARHRAGGDALATAQVLLGLLRDARDRGCENWPALEALISRRKPRVKRRRPSAMPRSVDRDCGA
jgi:DNA polymerase-3 subunit epsilon